MSRFDARRTADVVARQLVAAGFTVQRDGSGLSASQYLTVAIHGADDEALFGPEKIRVSDHALPPTYGAMNGWADYEIGPHDEAVSDWTRVVVRLCERAGRAAPPAVRALVTRRERAMADAKARAAEQAERMAPIYAALEAKRAYVDTEMERRGLAHLTGAKRKDARYKLNKEYERREAAQ